MTVNINGRSRSTWHRPAGDFNRYVAQATMSACLGALVLAAVAGCGRSEGQPQLCDIDTSEVRLPGPLQSVLDSPHTVELLSLNPERPDEPPVNDFYRWEILGRSQLDGSSAARIVHGLKAGVATASDGVHACFNPRHGLRITSSGETVDLVICFECVQIEVYKDGEHIDTLLTSDLPAALFDEVIHVQKLPMPPPADP